MLSNTRHFLTRKAWLPLTKISRARSKDKKWVSKELRQEINNKNKLLRLKLMKPTTANINNYKAANQMIQRKLKTAENDYYLEILNKKHSSNYNFWRTFGSIINPNKRPNHDPIQKIFHNGISLSNSLDISNAFNEYFTSIGKDLNSKFVNNSDLKRF